MHARKTEPETNETAVSRQVAVIWPLKSQAPYQIGLLHALIQQIRSGNGPLPVRPKRIAWVGHSYGSILGNNLAAAYPGDVDAYLLTGLALPKPGDNALPGQFRMGLTPAATFDPARFPPAQYPPGYLVTARKAGRRDTFYGADGDFDPAVYDADYARMGTLSAGEALTQNLFPAPAFNGPVFVLTGQQDATFCGNGTRQPPHEPDCGSGATSQLAAVQLLFPAVTNFDYYAQPRAGHVQMTHYSAKDGFEKALRFLGNWLQHPDAATS